MTHTHRFAEHREFVWVAPPNETIQAMPLEGWQEERRYWLCDCGEYRESDPARDENP